MKKIIFILVTLFASIVIGNASAQTAPPPAGKSIPAAQYYEGGQDAMYKFINANTLYPPNAKRNRIQGECIVHLVIEADGKTSNLQVVKNISGGCGDEALRVVRLLKFKPPGYRFDTNIPVYFKL
ncbi:MAG TPA: energy transducer TonB [Cytophagaceae bacterium]|jgi:protein TonB|nr:energy transducer TonB [Cytophagaceae bacterium]